MRGYKAKKNSHSEAHKGLYEKGHVGACFGCLSQRLANAPRRCLPPPNKLARKLIRAEKAGSTICHENSLI